MRIGRRAANGTSNMQHAARNAPTGAQLTLAPCEIASTVAACLASIAGAWKPVDATSGPISTRSVAAAIAARVVHASHRPRVDPSGRS
jgi:hypothetical protein